MNSDNLQWFAFPGFLNTFIKNKTQRGHGEQSFSKHGDKVHPEAKGTMESVSCKECSARLIDTINVKRDKGTWSPHSF